ncbi:MAG: DNA polymerase I [Clostridiales Family XIII bacterium]|jgi:DNA polymerase-1|nr:DNA polymerase I [Clostridiales Family XIII bacterium]
MDNNKIVIIDGNSLVNRAYFAITRPMITRDGVYTHAIFGFMNMFEKIMRDYSPAYAVVAFDRKAPTFRHIEYKEYKAGRRKTPPELLMQFPLLKELLEALNIKMLEMDGFEADDIIGAVAKNAEAEGLEPLIITGDKDALQLATEKTKILLTRRGVSEFELYDKAAMIEKYGFTPEEFIDFKGLMGDQSDNIPGVPGVGEKTAQKLIQEFKSVENLLANLDKVGTVKLRDKLEEYAGQARMSRRLAEINTFVPIDTDFDAYRVKTPDAEKLTDIYVRLEFNSFLKKLGAGQGSVLAPGGSGAGDGRQTRIARMKDAKARYLEKVQGVKTRIIRSSEGLQALMNAAGPADYAVLKVFADHSGAAAPKAYGISMLIGDECFYLDIDGIGEDETAASLSGIFGKLAKGAAGHNLQADILALIPLGLADHIDICFDTAVGQYILEPTRKDYSLALLISEYFQEIFKDDAGNSGAYGQIDMFAEKDADCAAFGALYCSAVDALMQEEAERLAEDELCRLFESAELPLIKVLAGMEFAGFAVDREELHRVGDGLSENISGIAGKIHDLAGGAFNINSPAQLGVVLFEKLGLPSSKKTKTGYATGAEVLEKLRDKHEIIDLILEYRMLAKISGTYVGGLLPLIGGDGKIHAHFQQTVTATGRISCTEPNLQNIPIKQPQGREIRKAFVTSGEDYVLTGADYSQIELRVLAHLSGDEALLEDFRKGADIHRRTASRVFGLSEDEVTPLQRGRAKAVNFGVIYGMSSFGLSEELGITRKEAEAYIDDYFKAHPAVRAYMDEQIGLCRMNGYVSTILGRRRRIPEINTSAHNMRQLGERLAMNTPIQGSAADIMKLAMIKTDKALREHGLRSKLILQVHDELIIETALDELETVKLLLKENMENAVQLDVPLTVEINVGKNWYALK